MLERNFEPKLIDHIEDLFPGAVCLKNDAQLRPGIPDRIVLWEDRWAMLETKAWKKAKRQPNQAYYVDLFDSMSFARFVDPSNMEEVLGELQQAFQSRRYSRHS